MARPIFQLRRGEKITEQDGTVVKDDWAQYTEEKPEEAIPREGELVLEYDNGVPRLKIGNGIDKFADLPYMSVDSFILPKTASVHLDPNEWKKAEDDDDDRYYQIVTVQNAIITTNSKVDLTPDAAMLDEFHGLDLAFVAENDDGNVSVFCIGEPPTKPYTINATVTEVVCDV
jgi:hypothetical protein